MTENQKIASYRRLNLEERETIALRIAEGQQLSQISLFLGRNRSSITREVKRNLDSQGNYRSVFAHRRAVKNASLRSLGKSKISKNFWLRGMVETGILEQFSPQQISNRLKKDFPTEKDMQVSHESIYSYLYTMPRRELKTLLLKELRRKHRHRRALNRPKKSPKPLEDMILIDQRPSEVEGRSVPGHWEGDLLIGRNRQSALGVLLERKTRFTLLVPLKNRKSETIREKFGKAIMKLPKQLRKSLTYDQGREMADHKGFTKDTKMPVYFAHPASPWERGSTENTNGLLRQYFPKGTDFSKIKIKEINYAQNQLNKRPRAVLKYFTPAEVLASELR